MHRGLNANDLFADPLGSAKAGKERVVSSQRLEGCDVWRHPAVEGSGCFQGHLDQRRRVRIRKFTQQHGTNGRKHRDIGPHSKSKSRDSGDCEPWMPGKQANREPRILGGALQGFSPTHSRGAIGRRH